MIDASLPRVATVVCSQATCIPAARVMFPDLVFDAVCNFFRRAPRDNVEDAICPGWPTTMEVIISSAVITEVESLADRNG